MIKNLDDQIFDQKEDQNSKKEKSDQEDTLVDQMLDWITKQGIYSSGRV